MNFASWGGILIRPNNSSVTIGQTKMPPHPRLIGFMATLILWCHLLISDAINISKSLRFPFQLQAASDWSGVRREVDVASHNVRQLGSLLFEMEVTNLTVIPRDANDYDRDQIFEIDCPQKSILIDYRANRLPTATLRSTTPI